MSRRKCCCGECWIRTDDFDRTASTDLGGKWHELEGDWGTYGYFAFELVEDWSTVTHSPPYPPEGTGTANAILMFTEPEPARSAGEMYIELDVYGPSVEVDDVYHLYPCCPSYDEIGELVATYKYLGDYLDNGHVYWEISITDGTSTDTHISQVGETQPLHVTLYVCTDREVGMIRGGVWPSENKSSTWVITSIPDNRYGGIGHNVTSHLTAFDNFEIGELRTEKEVCHACFCMCDLTPMPKLLTGTFVHAAERMSCLNGISWSMEYEDGLSSPIWVGEAEITTVETPPVTQRVVFTLSCTSTWTLNIVVYEGLVQVEAGCFTSTWFETPTQVTARTAEETPTPLYYSTCNPLSLVYGPWEISARDDCNWCYKFQEPLIPCLINPGGPIGGPECQGEFWIVITEAA